ncbi:unnamed protein product [Linum trigynum]
MFHSSWRERAVKLQDKTSGREIWESDFSSPSRVDFLADRPDFFQSPLSSLVSRKNGDRRRNNRRKLEFFSTIIPMKEKNWREFVGEEEDVARDGEGGI